MEKMTKSCWVIVLSLFLLLAMLSGCASSTGSDVTTVKTGQTAGETSSSQNAAGNGTTMFADTLSIEWLIPENAAIPFDLKSLAIQEVKKRLNVELKFNPVPESDAETKISTLLATNSIPDIITVSLSDLQQYASTGMFLNVSDYTAEAADYLALVEGEDRKVETAKLKVNGGLYGLQTLERYRIPVAPQAIIRTDLLKEQNIATPTTWDELYDAMLKIKAKYPDSYAFSSRNGTNYLIGQIAFMLGSGGYMGFDSERGMYFEPKLNKWIYGPTNENFKRVVQFLHKSYADGLLDPDYAIMNRDIEFEKLSTGKLFCNFDNTTFITSVFNPAIKEINADARFDILPPLSYNGTDTRSYRFQRDWTTFNAISSKVDRPKDVMRFINWIYTKEGADLLNFGVEGITYEIKDGKPAIKAEVLEKFKAQSDPYAKFRSTYGLGMYCFALYADDTFNEAIADPEFVANGHKIDEWTQQGKVTFMPGYPAFTDAEAETLKNLETQLGSMFNQEIDKFIIGTRDISEYEQFISDLRALGVEDLEKVFNGAQARLTD